MIQRIQSVWLLLASVAMALTFKFKFAAGFKVENTQNLPKDVLAGSHFMASLFAIAFTAACFVAIFLFKKRKLQMQIVTGAILVAIIATYFLYSRASSLTNVTYSITAILPIFAIGFAISALRCIWQDEKKIKELNSNRLR
jgi:peptidoglycan/LPS O-acetylase OafA/YrhL